jgi:hypothetical protein
MMHWSRVAIILVCLTSFVAPVNAAVVVYSDKSTFLADTGATSATTIPTTPSTNFPVGEGFTSGDLSFTLVPGESTRFVIDEFSARLSGNELGLSGKESLDVDIDTGPVFSFGFDFVEPEFDPNVSGTFVESTFTVTLKNDLIPVGTFTFDRPNDVAAFVGVLSDIAFNRVEIRETVGDIGNEFFGQFYIGMFPTVVLDIQPEAAVNPVSTSHTVTATVTTGGGLPVSGIVVEFRVEGSVNFASSCLSNAEGQCDVTYAGPAFPGADSITAFADTNIDGQQNANEPSDTATKAWVLPASTPGSVTGGGQITAGAGHVAFGFNAMNTTKGLQGHCNVVEPLLDVHIKCTDVTALVLSGTQATFLGNGTHDGAPVTYRIDVNDQGEPGAGHDTFSIMTSSGYVRSGTLSNGNIQVRN